ncbi:MarR family winged helix-turn-helix transcriptional regulator [Mammaliicoccus sciuri]|uniref:MarR family winged helix-turn-helix transcriptional regulator n=1 Tax=Mammaliicoccus sciuri TaxID=1296 RepID=UPI000BBF218A|nr:MarR family winged helix-turn-helix transcriptional regulator [Mammaliicoccus sciuri]MDO0957340.1 MarR family winged helix-turn-helix transcriptional regulator [Mammaliicoccus sciuri]PCM41091.1 MarR family transcriptional regulator [Mammaliicoccus sciuri]UXU78135.1 MarR family winged helix-turn-helix transcriptional regulator [Mammaliicoccus sciuri]
MNLHDLIGYLIHRNDVKMTNYFTKRLKPYGVTPEQWSIMSILSPNKSTTQKDLAKAIHKNQTTVVRMIQSMERKGIVKKTFNKDDRRAHDIMLSQKGEELKQMLLPIVTDAHNFVTSNLTSEETLELKRLLDKLYDTTY